MPRITDLMPPKLFTAQSDQDGLDVVDDLADAAPKLPLGRKDLHTRALQKLATQRVAEWNSAPPDASSVRVPTERGPLNTTDVVPGAVAVPTLDESGSPVPFAAKAVFRALNALPLVDEPAPWDSPQQARELVAAVYGRSLPSSHIPWTEVDLGRATELMAFQGIGAHRLVGIDAAADPDGAASMIDLSWMAALPVRDGLEPYGAAAYFSADRRLLRVQLAHDDSTHRPGDASWSAATFRWRTALFTAATVADHLGTTHYLVANVMVRATREQLPPAHPLRRLLTPHLYRTVDVNHDAALMLSAEGGMAHRTFGFTYAGLARLLMSGIDAVSLRPFPELVDAQGVVASGDGFPYATDGRALWDVVHRYVEDWFTLHHGDRPASADPAVRAWWQELITLAPNAGLVALTNDAQLVEAVTQFIWWVSGFHSHIGNVVGYLDDPAFCAGKLRAGADVGDIQGTLQLMNLAAVTGLSQPRLLEDFTHLAPADHHDASVSLMRRFTADLASMSDEIAARNARRELSFGTFDPRLLESSVSV